MHLSTAGVSIHDWLVALVLVTTAGCATAPTKTQPASDEFDSRSLAYDSLVFEFVEPSVTRGEVAAASAGDGAREGAGMMMAAPVGCMQAGMFYGLCLGMAPFFPLLAANRVQDPDISRQELEALASHIEGLNLQQRFRDRIEQLAREAGLPLADQPADQPAAAARTARLTVELSTMRLEHGGYKGGSITLTQPYRVTLLDTEDRVLNVISGERFSRVDVDDWPEKAAVELDSLLHEWIDRIADKALRDTVLEWQPKVVLGPVAPQPTSKRNIIGVRQEFWPFVDSTRPRLAWQTLDEVLEPDILEDITELSYELRIGGYAGATRYFVSGLQQPNHEVNTDLMPCTYYRWHPRAHFRYRGVIHTTSLRTRPWSRTIDVDDHYLIKTPAPGCKEPSWRSEINTAPHTPNSSQSRIADPSAPDSRQ